jgi:hypothetical protein
MKGAIVKGNGLTVSGATTLASLSVGSTLNVNGATTINNDLVSKSLCTNYISFKH